MSDKWAVLLFLLALCGLLAPGRGGRVNRDPPAGPRPKPPY
jgi:hypothetical protein